MPAGLLLSPTARTVRSGPGREPSRRRCRRPQVPLPRRQERPAARLRKVPWELSPSPSCAVRRRGCSCGAFRHTGPRTALPRAHPRQDGWGKSTATGPHPCQGPAMASLPCLGRHASFLPCPLSREYRSRCLPAPPVASDPPPVFPLPDLLRSGASVPLLSRPEDCALNQHFSSHPGTFVQRKMIL